MNGRVCCYIEKFMKITPYNLFKGVRYLKNYGWKEFWIRLKEKSESEDISYSEWYAAHQTASEELEEQRKQCAKWKSAPCISILVPAYCTPKGYLRQMIESVQKQTYPFWELCIVDASDEKSLEALVMDYSVQDKRIRYQHLKKNRGIAFNMNAAFQMASGSYIALLDQDDMLAKNALFEAAYAIVYPQKIKQSGVHWKKEGKKYAGSGTRKETYLPEDTAPDVIYTDEDKITEDADRHFEPHFKPDFSLDLLRSHNYMAHFLIIKKELAQKAGGWQEGFDGDQKYDFIFRCIEQAEYIVHIPKVLYHGRMHLNSTVGNQESEHYALETGKRAIAAHLQRCGILAEVTDTGVPGFYQVRYLLRDQPLVSIIIPNKDEIESLEQCLKSIARSSYSNYEIIIVENNSTRTETFDYYRTIPHKVVTWDSGGEFNYSAINNFGVRFANGEYLVLLNNDVEILTEDWLEKLLGNCQRPEAAIAGARLYYPDDSIQHAGIVVGIGGHARGVASNMFVGLCRVHDSYLHKAEIQLNYSAVTAACMMIRKSVFEEVGGFTERLSVAFNDVDLCLKVRKAGYLVVYDPYVEAYHYESKSRGQENSEEKLRRFQSEIEYMRTKWNDILRYGDPYYNPNLTRIRSDYSLGTQ